MRSIWKIDDDYLSNLLVSSLMVSAVIVLLLATAMTAAYPFDLPAQEVMDWIGPVAQRSSDSDNRSGFQQRRDWLMSEQAIAGLEQTTISQAEALSRRLETAYKTCMRATETMPRFLEANRSIQINARCTELNQVTQEVEIFLKHLDEIEFKRSKAD